MERAERINVAVKHPVTLDAEEMDLSSDDVCMLARDAYGNTVRIVASRRRWNEALMPRLGPKPSPQEVARSMYLRGEIEVEDFEAAL